MPNKQKHHPVSFRPPEADRAWLLAQAEEWDMPVNQLLTRALREYRRRWQGQPRGLDCPCCGDRMNDLGCFTPGCTNFCGTW